MPYITSAFQNTSGNFSDYFVLANQVSDGWFGTLVVLCFFIVMFVSMKQYGTKQAIGASMVVTMIFTIIARAARLTDDLSLYITIFTTALVTAYIYWRKGDV
jgi:hypothetical protein